MPNHHPLDPILPAGAELGHWQVVKLLGEGGMGRVYLAQHNAIGRRVALKVLKRALARSPELVERFFAEAHAANRIHHPGIVEVTDCFIAEDGTPCLVMELLEGCTLAEEMAAARIHHAQVAAIGAEVALALDAAHRAGVIHRDLKPDNLFLVDGGGVKVLDFGVAKLLEPMPKSTVQTVAGSIMGTPDYMAPEQLAGKPVDGRADIYALGASLYHAVTGRPPFVATNFGDLVVMHLTTPATPPSRFAEVPPLLERALLAMLAKEPGRRPLTMGHVAQLLSSVDRTGPRSLSFYRDVPVTPARAGTAAFTSSPSLSLDVVVGELAEHPPAAPATLLLGSASTPEMTPEPMRPVVLPAPIHALARTAATTGSRLAQPARVQPLQLQWLRALPLHWFVRMRNNVARFSEPTLRWTWAAVAAPLCIALGGATWAVARAPTHADEHAQVSSVETSFDENDDVTALDDATCAQPAAAALEEKPAPRRVKARVTKPHAKAVKPSAPRAQKKTDILDPFAKGRR